MRSDFHQGQPQAGAFTKRAVLLIALALLPISSSAGTIHPPVQHTEQDGSVAIPSPSPTVKLTVSGSTLTSDQAVVHLEQRLIDSGHFTEDTLSPDVEITIDTTPCNVAPSTSLGAAVYFGFARMGYSDAGDCVRGGQTIPAGYVAEGYVVDVVDTGSHVSIVIGAQQPVGAYYGAITVAQMLVTDDDLSAESSIAKGVIRDYPDTRVRGLKYQTKFELGGGPNASDFSFQQSTKDAIGDALEYKANLLLSSDTDVTVDESTWTASQAVIKEVIDYMDDRFMKLILNGPPVGSPNEPRHYDGTWMVDEAFRVVEAAESVIPNGSFEVDHEGFGVPIGWPMPSADPGGAAWTRIDSGAANEVRTGQRSIELHVDQADAANAAVLIYQSLPVRVPPGAYALRVYANGTVSQGSIRSVIELDCDDGIQRKVGQNVLAVDFVNNTWNEVPSPSAGPPAVVTAPAGSDCEVLVTLKMNPNSYGTVYFDDVSVLPVDDVNPTNGIADSPLPVSPTMLTLEPEISVENLISNGSFEQLDGGGDPQSWEVSGSPNGEASISTTEQRTGTQSLHFDLNASQNVALRQYIEDGPGGTNNWPAGYYLLRFRYKSQDLVDEGVFANVRFYSQFDAAGKPVGTSEITSSALVGQRVPLSTPASSTRWFLAQSSISLPAGTAGVSVTIRAPSGSFTGKVWFDDISFQRVSGDLQEVNTYGYEPVVEDSQGVGLSRGTDYELYESTRLRQSPAANAAPTHVVLDSSAVAVNDIVYLSFDKNLVAESNDKPGVNLCGDVVNGSVSVPFIEEVIEPALDLAGAGILGTAIDAFNINIEEIRGINRSGACHNTDGTPASHNGTLLARVAKQAADHAASSLELWTWSDSFNPHHYGGGPDYQKTFNGRSGRMACGVTPDTGANNPNFDYPGCDAVDGALADPSDPDAELLPTDVKLITWSYSPASRLRLNYMADFFDQQGFTQIVSHERNPDAMADWFAIASSLPGVEGTLSSAYTAGAESTIPDGLALAWNNEWRRKYFTGFESFDAIGAEVHPLANISLSGGFSHSDNGDCALGSKYPINEEGVSYSGGLCIQNDDGFVYLPTFLTDNSKPIQVSFDLSNVDFVDPPEVHAKWMTWDGSQVLTHNIIVTPTVAPQAETYEGVKRYTAVLDPPLDDRYDLLQPIIKVYEPSNSVTAALDNVMIARKVDGCPFGDDVLSISPIYGESTPVNTQHVYALRVQNLGCNDLVVTSVTTNKPHVATVETLPTDGIFLRAGEEDTVDITIDPLPNPGVTAFLIDAQGETATQSPLSSSQLYLLTVEP